MLTRSIGALRDELARCADPGRASAMTRYMQHRFRFFGVPSADRRRVSRGFVAAGRQATAGELLDTADALWAEPERELQYVATDLLRRWVGALGSADLGRVERLIRTKSWWDTVDSLAAHVVGPLVAADDRLVGTMDRWVDDTDMWIARTAILHQLQFKEQTDAERLFRYVDRRSDDTEFFIRKACAWALRQYARVDPDAVRGFVASRADRLSGLTRREATKHL